MKDEVTAALDELMTALDTYLYPNKNGLSAKAVKKKLEEVEKGTKK